MKLTQDSFQTITIIVLVISIIILDIKRYGLIGALFHLGFTFLIGAFLLCGFFYILLGLPK
jgi:hypothetical protein